MSSRSQILSVAIALTTFCGISKADNWPQFHGVDSLGVARGKAPTSWDGEHGLNIKWATPIPGLGLSSPVIWGDRIFLTTAVPESGDASLKVGLYGDIQPVNDATPQSWRVICIDRASGKVLWDKEATKGVPRIKRHTKSSHANSTVSTDGKHVVAFFGAEGLYCFDVDGELKWKKDFGPLDSGFYAVKTAQWGFGNSTIIHDGRLILQVDVQTDSFVAALDINDGREIWRTPRAEVPTWCTPAIYTHEGKKRIALNGWKHIGGYDFETGKEIWKIVGGGDIPVPTPIVSDGTIYLTSAHGSMRPVYAVKTSAEGDITPKSPTEHSEHIAWWADRRGNYMQTPIVLDGLLYLCMDNGLLSVLDAKSGKEAYKQRLGSGATGFTASGVAAGGNVYFFAEDGTSYVIKAGREYELVAENQLGDNVMASPAVADGVLFIRGEKKFYAIEEGAGGK